MREHLGEDFSGTVSAVTPFGVFVTLDAMFVEGLVHITELGGDYFKFDEARQELRGERTGIRYAIGARVRVQVSRVDLDGRKIDFRWVQDDLADATQVVSRKTKANPVLHKSNTSGKSSSVDVNTKSSAKRSDVSVASKIGKKSPSSRAPKPPKRTKKRS